MRHLFLAAIVGTLLVLATTGFGQEKTAPPVKKEASWIYFSLRDVIDQGATVFNQQGDHAGCYRMYQGGLIAVRPYISEHPELLKEVDDALQKAERTPRVVDRAFVLRHALDKIRARYRPADAAPPNTGDKTKQDKKIDDKKKVEPNKEPKDDKKRPEVKKEDKQPATTSMAPGGVSGKVVLAGKTGITGYLTLVPDDGQHFTTFVHPDGSFAFKTPVPLGIYRVTVATAGKEGAPPPIGKFPDRYAEPASTPLVVYIEQTPTILSVHLRSK